MQAKLKWLLAACVLVIVAGGIILLWSLHNSVAESELWRKHASTVLQYAIPVIIALFGWTAQQLIASRPRQSTPEQLQEARKALIGRGHEWWRGIPQPAWPGRVLRAGLSPLEVIWAGTDAHGHPVSGRTSDVTDLAHRFRSPGSFRLVIQGPPGSGKSIFARLLMTELLPTANSGPVPVFLPLWSWDPHREPLHDWIKRRIREDYPELDDAATFGPTAITNLVDQGLILPVLDGLDSLPRLWRTKVLDDDGLMSQDRLILTCRTNQPARMDGFVVISPEPVERDEALRFLGAVTGSDENAWAKCGSDPDFADIYSKPRLIYTISTISTISTIGERTKADPAELAKKLRQQHGPSLPDRLLELMVPALLSGPGIERQDYPPYYQGREVEWLSRLAPLGLWSPVDLRHPGRDRPAEADLPGMSCIAWWNLHRGVRFLDRHQAWLRAATASVLAFLLICAIFGQARSWRYTLLTSAAYGIMIFFAGFFLAADHSGRSSGGAVLAGWRHPALAWWFSRSWARCRPLVLAGAWTLAVTGLLIGYRVATIHARPPDFWRWSGFRTKLIGGPNIALIHGQPHEVWYWVGFLTGLFDGLNLALIVVFTFVIAQVPRAPRGLWAVGSGPVGRSQTRKSVSALLIGTLFGLEWGISAVLKGQHPHASTLGQAMLTGLITGIDFAVGVWLFQWSSAWSRAERAPDPRSAARADLLGALSRPLILGFTFAFAFGISAPFNFTTVDVWAWFVVGLALGALETEWPLYFVAINAIRGRGQLLPIRLMRFLEICRVCGLVSSAGRAYQIHDDDLLRKLAGPPAHEETVSEPVAPADHAATAPAAAPAGLPALATEVE